MDIREAMLRMTTPVFMPGVSNATLVQKVIAKQRGAGSSGPRPKTPTPALGLGLDAGGVTVRPFDALHRLSRATALTIEDDVYAVYKHWGWIRYLGAFGHGGSPPQLSLDLGALRHVHANQRRVMSEDLGVGFGVLLAEEWCRAMGATGTIRTTDVDKALRDNQGFPGLAQAPGARKQPDYLLQYSSSGAASVLESRLLETKGTVNSGNGIAQLAHAMTQLTSLVLDGGTPQGIAISTVSTTSGVSYLAVDPEGESDPWTPEESTIDKAKTNRPTIRGREEALYVNRDEFFASATVTANATLADFAGLDEITAAWLPEDSILQSRRRPRPAKEIPLDIGTYTGVEFSISAPGSDGSLTVFQGVERGVEEALRSGNDERVREAQQRFSSAVDARSVTTSQEPSDREAVAVSDEGAILRVTVRN